MTTNHDDSPERTDPVLVRPYVVSDDDADPATWPETADLPSEDAAVLEDTAVQPAIVDEPASVPLPRRRSTGMPLWARLVALVLGVALAGGITLLVLDARGDKAPPQPSTALPRPGQVRPTDDAAVPSKGASPSAKVSSSASASVSATPSRHNLSPSAGTTRQQSAPARTPTLDPPPGSARSGKVTAASGRCLMLGGLLGVDGSPIQVASCAVASTFTLATDGTLRVSGRCAQITGDSTVRIDDCDGQQSAQWRSGPNGSMVNPASGQCITDPGRNGATTKAASCTGADDQRWSLA